MAPPTTAGSATSTCRSTLSSTCRNLGKLTDTMMGGGVIALQPDTIGSETLQRWYEDYRSGNAERGDILQAPRSPSCSGAPRSRAGTSC